MATKPQHGAMNVSDAERELLGILEDLDDELLALAQALLGAPSINPPGDERRAAAVAGEAMRRLGYDDVTTIARAEQRPNVLGEVGRGTRSLMLNGHLDTQPPHPREQWRTDPFDPVVIDGELYGVGASDMKCAVAAMIVAGGALARLDGWDGRLKVLLTADEESGSSYGARYVADEGLVRADAVLVGEAGGVDEPWDWIGVASRGSSRFRVKVRGTQMHTGLTDRLPSVNASEMLARVMVRMADEFAPSYPASDLVGHAPTVNLGVELSGGLSYSFCPGEAEFGVDVRTVPGMTFEQLSDEVEAFLAGLRAEWPQLDAEVEWHETMSWFPPSQIDLEHPLVPALARASRLVLGREVPLGVMPAFTDGSQWAKVGMPCIPAFGPGLLERAHRPNESTAVEELHQASRIFALAALGYFADAERSG